MKSFFNLWSSNSFKAVTIYFLVWRTALFLLSMTAGLFLKYEPTFPYAESILANRGLPQWLYSWGNFDGVHYLTIIEKGYFGTGLIQAFFPLYPQVVQVLYWVTKIDSLILALLLSNLAALAFFQILFHFVKDQYNQHTAISTLLVFSLFPTSFFLGAAYTESLFLSLVLGSYWAATKKKWLIAGLLAAGASATRIVGVLMVPALLIELWQQQLPVNKTTFTWTVSYFFKTIKKWTNPQLLLKLPKQALNMLWILLGSSGLLWYMTYLNYKFHDPLFFFHVQSEFGGGRQEELVFLPQVIWRYFKILATFRPIGLEYFALVQEFVITGLAVLALLWSLKRVRPGLVFFALAAILVPTLTGTFSSMPRYVLVAIPGFLMIANSLPAKNKYFLGYLGVSISLLIINTLLFIQGHWVA
jgi:Gpi18-like mannosyltransferase